MTLINTCERSVEFWQNESDASFLARGNFKLFIAHTVLSTDGQPITNLIWKCLKLNPRRTIAWEPIYGLNWCRGLPEKSGLWSSSDLDLSGTWQRCEVGHAYALSASGFWTASTDSTSSCLQVNRNEYKAGATEAVHVVLGLYDRKTSGFDPVYFSRRTVNLHVLMRTDIHRSY